MSDNIVSLTGEALPGHTPSDATAENTLAELLDEIRSGKINVDQVAIVMMVTSAGDPPGVCSYGTRASLMTVGEAHLLFSIGARMKVDLLLGVRD